MTVHQVSNGVMFGETLDFMPEKSLASSCKKINYRATCNRLQLKCDGTRWRTGGEVKGELTNGVCSQ